MEDLSVVLFDAFNFLTLYISLRNWNLEARKWKRGSVTFRHKLALLWKVAVGNFHLWSASTSTLPWNGHSMTAEPSTRYFGVAK